MSAALASPSAPASGPPRAGGDGVWLRPFDELAVGETHRSRARTVTETDFVKFAALTGDAIQGTAHDTWAATVLPLTYSIGLVSNSYIVALRRVLDCRPIAPVTVGETIHVECRIERLGEWTEDYGLVTGLWAIVTQDDVTAMTVLLEAVWRRTPL